VCRASARSPHRTEDRPPAEQENSQGDGGHQDEDWSSSATGGQPKQHADGDRA
jgi:hypothetical protein